MAALRLERFEKGREMSLIASPALFLGTCLANPHLGMALLSIRGSISQVPLSYQTCFSEGPLAD